MGSCLPSGGVNILSLISNDTHGGAHHTQPILPVHPKPLVACPQGGRGGLPLRVARGRGPEEQRPRCDRESCYLTVPAPVPEKELGPGRPVVFAPGVMAPAAPPRISEIGTVAGAPAGR